MKRILFSYPFIMCGLIVILLAASTVEAQEDWPKTKNFGDLRFRYESLDVENKKNRARDRIRARFGVKSQLDEATEIGFRLATGAGSPTSGNQTLDDTGTPKAIGLDLAWFKHEVNEFIVTGGKIKNPFYAPGMSQLVLDGDFNPEGIAVGYGIDLNPVKLGLMVGGFWLDERADTKDDSWLEVFQLTLGYKTDVLEVKLGGASYQFTELKDQPLLLGDSFGNSAKLAEDGETLIYANEYNVTNVSLQFGLEAFPLLVFADYAKNGGADEDNVGTVYGLSLGKGKFENIPWKLYAVSSEVESDAVLGALSDSDFFGGGTGGKGFKVGVSYATTKLMSIGLAYLDSDVDLTKDETYKYKKGMLDLKYKF